MLFLAALVRTLGVDYQFAVRQQFVADAQRGAEQSAAVVSQVEHKPLHTFGFQVFHGFAEFIVCGLAKAVKP